MSIIMRTQLSFEGNVEQLSGIADRWAALARAEQGVIDFRGYISEATGQLLFLEHYRDSEAFLIHKDLVPADLRAELYSLASLDSWEVYGSPSEEIENMVGAAGGHVFGPVALHQEKRSE